MVDFGDGATGILTTCTHDFVGTDRLEILCDGGKVVVDGSQQVTVSRLAKPEQEISDSMDPDAVRRLFTGQLDPGEYVSTETKTYESVWGHSTPRCSATSAPPYGARRNCWPRAARDPRRPAGQRHPPVQLARAGGLDHRLRRGRLPRRAEHPHRGRRQVPTRA